FDADTRVIGKLNPEAESAGIPQSTTLESVNGVPYPGLGQWSATINSTPPGDPVVIGFQRSDGREDSATVTLGQFPQRSDGGSVVGFMIRIAVLNFALPLICLVIGLWVAAARPTDPHAWLLLILLSFPEVAFLGPEQAFGGWLVFRGFWQ